MAPSVRTEIINVRLSRLVSAGVTMSENTKVFIQVVRPYSSTDTFTTWKNYRFILSERYLLLAKDVKDA